MRYQAIFLWAAVAAVGAPAAEALADPVAVDLGVADPVAVLAYGFLLGVLLAAIALALLPAMVRLEVDQRKWSGFPPAALAELGLRVMHRLEAHPRQVLARQAKAAVPTARGSLRAAL